jgi:glycerate kinase
VRRAHRVRAGRRTCSARRRAPTPAAVARLTARLDALAATWPRDPRGRPLTGAAGGLAGGLWAAFGARLEPGAPFVLDILDFDARMRASGAVIVGEGRLDATTLEGKIAGEIAVRARQAGVPAHAVCGGNGLTPFEARILDLQARRRGADPAGARGGRRAARARPVGVRAVRQSGMTPRGRGTPVG